MRPMTGIEQEVRRVGLVRCGWCSLEMEFSTGVRCGQCLLPRMHEECFYKHVKRCHLTARCGRGAL